MFSKIAGMDPAAWEEQKQAIMKTTASMGPRYTENGSIIAKKLVSLNPGTAPTIRPARIPSAIQNRWSKCMSSVKPARMLSIPKDSITYLPVF
jgi:hypothetical protein